MYLPRSLLVALIAACVVCIAYSICVDAAEPAFELPQYPEPPDNAWSYMLRAAQVAKETDADSGHSVIMEAQRDGVEPDYAKAAASYEPALKVLREGLYNDCRVLGLEFHETDFPELMGIRNLARALSWEARGHAQQGNPDRAIESIRDCLRLGRNISTNGALIHELIGIAIGAIGTQALSDALNTAMPAPEKLIEFAAWNEQNRRQWQSTADAIAIDAHWIVARRRTAAPELADVFEQYVVRVIEWARQPAHLRGPVPDEAELAGAENLPTAATYQRLAEKATMNEAVLAGSSIRCALEAYNIRESNYPRTLAKLVPDYIAELPLDAWSGRDFRYILGSLDGMGGYLLYSVGPDGDDDMGLVVWSPDDRDGDMLIGPVRNIFTGRRE